VPKAKPVLLEPVYKVEVRVPDAYMGDVMGDLSSRRGRISGMDQQDGFQVVRAEVPLAELYSYATTLRSLTQGRASHKRVFGHYEEVPREVADGIIAEHKAAVAAAAQRLALWELDVGTFEMEHDQAQEGRAGRPALEAVLQGDQGNHRRGPIGWRRSDGQPAPAARDVEGARSQHAGRQHQEGDPEGGRASSRVCTTKKRSTKLSARVGSRS
jgi:hypothetical protein